MTQIEYLKQQLLAVLAIDSPTGHTAAAAQYVLEQYRACLLYTSDAADE